MKTITLLAGLLVAAGFSSMASAHNYNGTLGTSCDGNGSMVLPMLKHKYQKSHVSGQAHSR